MKAKIDLKLDFFEANKKNFETMNENFLSKCG